VVKISLAGTRLSCRDDADFFFAILFLAGVNDERDRDAAGAADGMPTLLCVNYAIRLRDDVWIFECPRRRFE
jgi:hypothetical protein